MIDSYFDYLCDMVNIEKNGDPNTYYEMARVLHNMDWIPDSDLDNSYTDSAKNLRYKFANGSPELIRSLFEKKETTVLEYMIWMANTMYCIAEDHGYEDEPKTEAISAMFWGLCNNIGFMDFQDTSYFYPNCENQIMAKIKNQLSRNYFRDGENSFFHFQDLNPNVDIRKWTICKQLETWLKGWAIVKEDDSND